MKKLLCILLLVTMLPLSAMGEGRVFVDSAGREIVLPEEITRIAVTGPTALIAVYAIAPDLLVGIPSAWDEEALPFIDAAYADLPQLGQLYGGKSGSMNLETLLSAAPQVVIDVGEPKSTVAEDLDALGEQTGIPFVHVTMRTDDMGDGYRKLGELLGRETRAAVLADYCDEVYARTKAIGESVEKTKLLFIVGEDGLGVIARNSYHSEVIDMLSDNLAVVASPSSKGTGNEVDMEQILLWNPDAVIFSNGGYYGRAGEDPLWQGVEAIAGGQYWEVPVGPYNWMGFPPGVQRLLGMTWMAKLLYPDAADYDLYAETARYFDLFYHVELTRAQYDALMINALRR